jgi:RNA-binding protein 8A
MEADPPPQQPQAIVDFEADSEDLAWAGEAEVAQQQQEQQQAPAAIAAAAADITATPPTTTAAPTPATTTLPPHLAARLGPLPNEDGAHTRSGFEPARSADGWVLFVRGLHGEALEDDVLDFFSAAGHVKNLHLGLGRESGMVAGYALVEYADEGSARRAVADLDGGEFLGERLGVDFAFVKPRGDGAGAGAGGVVGRRRRRRVGGGGGGGGGGGERRDS